MKVVTSEEMREIDKLTIEHYKIPSEVLMERAALSVSKYVLERQAKNIVILAGPGNNGGDGVALGRILKGKVKNIKIFQLFPDDKLSEDCRRQIEIAEKFKISLIKNFPSARELQEADLIIDAIFGTGLRRKIEGELAAFINLINSMKKNVIAIDIPSGVSSDTGEILGDALRATITVTFGLPKRGHLLFPGREYVGNLFVEDIGFPDELICSDRIKTSLIDKKTALSLLPPRPLYSHKGNYGHILVIAGSVGKIGAAKMVAKSALRTGSGLVTLAIPSCLSIAFHSYVLEEMIFPLPCNGQTISAKAIEHIGNFITEKTDAIAFGPGVGINGDTEEILRFLLGNSQCPLVIDADGITILSKNMKLLEHAKAKTVITPHPGELSRLINISVKEIEKDRIEIARKTAKELNTTVVLKGAPTVISDSDGNVFINTTGNPGMATAGAGDVLTGIITSLIGQKLPPLKASILGVYLHGLSGDIAAKFTGYHSLIASDITDFLPQAFIELKDEMDK